LFPVVHNHSKVRRWAVNDYYEDKLLAEITEKGLETGDFVSELEL
jgi:chromatin structure-remodeling complex protein RSC7